MAGLGAVPGTRGIRFAIRGFGGEVGDTVTRVLFGMNRNRFNQFANVVGGRIIALVRGPETMPINQVVRRDRSFLKLADSGSLEKNTASSYGYADVIGEARLDPGTRGRLIITGTDGRALNVDYVNVPNQTAGIPELEKVDLLLDATGVGFKKQVDGQMPAGYATYPGLVTMFSAPVKTVEGIPHHLNGLKLVEPAQLNATGSCSTHAGVDVIRHIREPLMRELGLVDGEFIIQGGQFNATHSLTPSDGKVLYGYRKTFIPQTTGFGGAAKIVYPVPHIGNIDATTGRYDSYLTVRGTQANGISMFSLCMTISVKAGTKEITDVMIRHALMDAALDPEGQKHIGIVNPDAFNIKTNKQERIFTSMSLTGMPQTAMLPLGANIQVTRVEGERTVNGQTFVDYIVSVRNVGYDNRLGFTTDLLDEMNQVAAAKLGTELIPGFHFPTDLGSRLALASVPTGKELFAKALELTEGEILMNPANRIG